MKSNFNKLKPAETERLALLAEELAEATQIVGKILRHGYSSFNPSDPREQTNRELLVKELGDVYAVLWLMNQRHDISIDTVNARCFKKLRTLETYLHHNTVNP